MKFNTCSFSLSLWRCLFLGDCYFHCLIMWLWVATASCWRQFGLEISLRGGILAGYSIIVRSWRFSTVVQSWVHFNCPVTNLKLWSRTDCNVHLQPVVERHDGPNLWINFRKSWRGFGQSGYHAIVLYIMHHCRAHFVTTIGAVGERRRVIHCVSLVSWGSGFIWVRDFLSTLLIIIIVEAVAMLLIGLLSFNAHPFVYFSRLLLEFNFNSDAS